MFSAFKRCVLACFSLQFYEQSVGDSFGRRFFTLWLACFLLIGSGTVWFSRALYLQLPQLRQSFEEFGRKFPELLPEGLILNIDLKEAKLSTNLPGPHKIDLSKVFSFLKPQESLLVVDAEAEGINPATYEGLVLVGPQGVSVTSAKGKIEYRAYREMLKESEGSFIIDRKLLAQLPASLNALLAWTSDHYVLIFCGLMLLIVPTLALSVASWKLVSLLMYTGLGMLVLRLLRRQSDFSQTYLMGLYISIPLLVLQMITLFAFSFWLYLLAYVLLLILFTKEPKQTVEPGVPL